MLEGADENVRANAALLWSYVEAAKEMRNTNTYDAMTGEDPYGPIMGVIGLLQIAVNNRQGNRQLGH